jgi:hypothetical protein
MQNQINKIGFILSVLSLSILFTAFILLGDNWKVRSSRACFPIIWAGHLTTSFVGLYDWDTANTMIRDTFSPAFGACVNSAADLFYGKNFFQHLMHLPDKFLR